MGCMIVNHELFDAFQRCTYCRDLRQNINAIAVLFDHPGNPSDLTLQAFEAF